MAKRKRSAQVSPKRAVLREEISDDFLPSPEELSKYKELDPDIINWLKKRAEEEQKFRHRFQQKKLIYYGSCRKE